MEFHLRPWNVDEQDADYWVARDPSEALEYVRNIRTAESMLGQEEAEARWSASPAEGLMMRYRTGVA